MHVYSHKCGAQIYSVNRIIRQDRKVIQDTYNCQKIKTKLKYSALHQVHIKYTKINWS